MNQNLKTILFAAVAIAIGIVAFVVKPGAPANDATHDVGQPFFPDFKDPLAATSLEVVKFDEALAASKPFKVALENGIWVIPSHENYPADAEEQMKDSAALLLGLEKLGIVSGDKEDHEKFGVKDPDEVTVGARGFGTLLRMSDKDGRVLAKLIIGNAVKEQSGQSYVRVPGSDRVYIAAITPSRLSTSFTDWVERDLLKAQQGDIKKVVLDNYRINETARRVEDFRVDRDRVELTHESSPEMRWVLPGLSDEQEVNKDKLEQMRRALDDMKIVSVERKPSVLVANLRRGLEVFSRTGQEALETIAESLEEKGFYLMREGEGPAAQFRVFSNEGEVIVEMNDGLEYVLRFGEITSRGEPSTKEKPAPPEAAPEKDAKAPEKDGKAPDPKKPAKTGSNRYMYVLARLDETAIKKPDLMPIPEYKAPVKPDAPKPDVPKPDAPKPDAPKPDAPKPDASKPDATPKKDDAKPATPEKDKDAKEKQGGCEDAPAKSETDAKPAPKADEKKSDEKKADDKKTDEKKTETPPAPPIPTTPLTPTPPAVPGVDPKVQHEALVAAIKAENARRLKEHELKVAEARKNVDQLNARFAEWYYVISDADFKKIRLTRKDIVRPNKAFLNKRDGDKFLAENKGKEGVITTASRLQYKVIKEGTGKQPMATDKVSVNYKGTLLDNTVFDQSPAGMPRTFEVDGVIPGWTEALLLMKEGGKLQLFIPSNLAYAEKGHGDNIGPNAVLIFEVELVAVK